jgi:hypothetical protein
MKTHLHSEQLSAEDPSPTIITVRLAHNPVDVETLLPLSVLQRLCSDPAPSRVRQCNVHVSQVIVALDGDAPLGFAAFKTAAGPVRVAHEFWVDALRQSRAGCHLVHHRRKGVQDGNVGRYGRTVRTGQVARRTT